MDFMDFMDLMDLMDFMDFMDFMDLMDFMDFMDLMDFLGIWRIQIHPISMSLGICQSKSIQNPWIMDLMDHKSMKSIIHNPSSPSVHNEFKLRSVRPCSRVHNAQHQRSLISFYLSDLLYLNTTCS